MENITLTHSNENIDKETATATETEIETPEQVLGFSGLSLSEPILRAIEEAGYITPTPIQARVIPVFMSGKDLIGQAQTGTGKTAAFALPILESIDLLNYEPQVLVLTPTRELANQVCESFRKYSSHLEGLRTIAVYGGLEYGAQLRALLRGVHIVVGTPGRVMDHIDRGSFKLGAIKTIVLDEADEMLNMGFKEDVEWILERAPKERRMALFSATMPEDIRDLARRFMRRPEEITIKQRTATVENTRQRYWQITGLKKIDALSRLLEAEDYDAALIFVSRKVDTLEVTEQLSSRGFEVAALNGDLPQNHRERIIHQLKSGKLNIVVATDVAARGLDVDRISHVINYDLPQDQESYIHRIGRTGRAGKKGEAIIFVSAREKRWLNMLEKTTRQPIEPMEMPTAAFICDKRVEKFKKNITSTIEAGDLDFFDRLVDKYAYEYGINIKTVAAALAKLLQKDCPLQVSEQKEIETTALREFESKDTLKVGRRNRKDNEPEEGMVSYRVEVGRFHGVQPGNLVGAISGETGMSSKYIGRIKIMDEFSIVDLPEDMPKEFLDKLKEVYVCHRMLRITPDRFNKKAFEGGKASKAEETLKVEMFFNKFEKKPVNLAEGLNTKTRPAKFFETGQEATLPVSLEKNSKKTKSDKKSKLKACNWNLTDNSRNANKKQGNLKQNKDSRKNSKGKVHQNKKITKSESRKFRRRR